MVLQLDGGTYMRCTLYRVDEQWAHGKTGQISFCPCKTVKNTFLQYKQILTPPHPACVQAPVLSSFIRRLPAVWVLQMQNLCFKLIVIVIGCGMLAHYTVITMHNSRHSLHIFGLFSTDLFDNTNHLPGFFFPFNANLATLYNGWTFTNVRWRLYFLSNALARTLKWCLCIYLTLGH